MIATTARAIIKRACQITGIIGAGVDVEATDEADAFLTLTGMVDTWKGSILRAPVGVRQPLVLTAGDGDYSLGPAGADLTSVRPLHGLTHATRIENNREIPIDVLTRGQWESEPDRTTQGSVDRVYVDHLAVPLAQLHALPVPLAATTIVIYFRQELAFFADLTTVYTLPEGYYEALVYNLGLRIGPEHGFPLDADSQVLAQRAVDVLTTRNEADSVPTMELDSGLTDFNPGMGGEAWLIGG